MPQTIRILGVHGLGKQEANWFEEWKATVRKVYEHSSVQLEFEACYYDPIFDDVDLSVGEIARAAFLLGRSGIENVFRRERGLFDRIEWTAGYVVAWVSDKGFQAQSRALFLEKVKTFKPHIILAHSLGSLVTYNALSHPDAKADDVARVLKAAHYVTFGSQLANDFVKGNLANGRLKPLPNVRRWWHLFNPADPVFTKRISLPEATNFTQVLTPFGGGLAAHNSSGYLGHAQAVAQFWRPFEASAMGASKLFGFGPQPAKARARPQRETKGRRRALLVGINDYIDPGSRLEGCVNDVFAMSAVLQECGFAPDEIRTCLDRRATAQGIRERLEWLLEDARPGDERVFYYSGHGAQMPEYGPDDEPDRLVETLVPCDFDWSMDTAVTDEHIAGLYSQLPYDTRLAMIFDCCHSGGIHRQGGARPRGINPPDDIRHRQLKWDAKAEMWVDRDFARINPEFATNNKTNAEFFGKSGAKLRLGRAAMLRAETAQAEYRRAKAQEGIVGPYLPLIIEACAEDQFSYEYRHGATSYGAFTFTLASLLRKRAKITFTELVEAAREQLAELQYAQTPQILGPTQVVNAQVPWRTGGAGRGGPPGSATPRLSG